MSILPIRSPKMIAPSWGHAVARATGYPTPGALHGPLSFCPRRTGALARPATTTDVPYLVPFWNKVCLCCPPIIL